MKTALVTGSGGFIGHHLLHYLRAKGYQVQGVDIKRAEFCHCLDETGEVFDLRKPTGRMPVGEVYHLAADMGGIGYITKERALITRNNALIDANVLISSVESAGKLFFASSACIYPQYRQLAPDALPLKEQDAFPADPEEGYGLEKLFMEKMCQYHTEEGKLETRIARFHNVYGPEGTWEGGAEKAPAAICRKVAMAPDGGFVEVWGDGKQTRSFMYIDDCVEGIYRIMQAGYSAPVNLGSTELITINALTELVIAISGKHLKIKNVPGPQGVRGRNSDNNELIRRLNWEPSIPLKVGMQKTYEWVLTQVNKRKAA
ncbi:MAG: NAD-dependent epimerase/dehydratase family protein [Dehalococcoidia bacterium]|nr:NAD-dependent epimerase/dehydratase family protein [Dehalococcoidia bacterium]